MTTRIYARTSAADAGASAEELYLDTLRRHAQAVDSTPPEEYVDRDPNHRGPRPALERLSLSLIEGDVVIVARLSHVARNLHHLAETLRRWLEVGVSVISIEDAIDGTTVAGMSALEAFVRIGLQVESERLREAHIVGAIRSRVARDGAPLRRPEAIVNTLEVQQLYTSGGRAGKFLSVSAIAKTCQVSRGTIARVLRSMRERGLIDPAAREAFKSTAGGKGGRPPRRLTFDEDEIRALHGKGLGARRILRSARSLPKSATVYTVRRIINSLGLRNSQSRSAPTEGASRGVGG